MAAMNVVVGERMRTYIEARGISSDRIALVPNWSDDERIVPIPAAANPLRAQWDLTDRFVVGYSGNLGRAHEVETLVAAAERLKNAPDIVFLFVGEGHHLRRLRQRASQIGVEGQFQFRPYQARADLPYSLTVPDVHWLSLRPELEGFIVPSKFYGIAAAGRPTIVVAAADGEISRLVADHDCGVQVSPGDGDAFARAILRLRDDTGYRQRLGSNARRASEFFFSKKTALAAWVAILDRTEQQP
jgi:glycosyltransferase involved in cell wall biosynthesis